MCACRTKAVARRVHTSPRLTGIVDARTLSALLACYFHPLPKDSVHVTSHRRDGGSDWPARRTELPPGFSIGRALRPTANNRRPSRFRDRSWTDRSFRRLLIQTTKVGKGAYQRGGQDEVR